MPPSNNMALSPGYRVGNRALFLTQILTQNRKFRCGRFSIKGKNHRKYPDRTAPNGRFSGQKTLLPILLSSRSGVRVPPGVPLLTSGGFSKLNMVDIAQLVSASDCGSEGRGFESHYPPQKNRRYLRISPVFIWFWADNGIRKAVKKTVRWTVFRPWENPWDAGCGSKEP